MMMMTNQSIDIIMKSRLARRGPSGQVDPRTLLAAEQRTVWPDSLHATLWWSCYGILRCGLCCCRRRILLLCEYVVRSVVVFVVGWSVGSWGFQLENVNRHLLPRNSSSSLSSLRDSQASSQQPEPGRSKPFTQATTDSEHRLPFVF